VSGSKGMSVAFWLKVPLSKLIGNRCMILAQTMDRCLLLFIISSDLDREAVPLTVDSTESL